VNRDGSPRVRRLSEALEAAGNGHACQVIAFCGGDNFTSDDLSSLSCVLSPFYLGAGSVCLSNGGVHEEPVQVLNADCLWNASIPHFGIAPSGPGQVEAILRDLRAGRFRPDGVFAEGAVFHRVCRRLWGGEAGDRMYRAYLCGGAAGQGPVSRVWWAVTRDVRHLRSGEPERGWTWERVAGRWDGRREATASALALAREAARFTDDEDVRGFVLGLEVGGGFAGAMALLARHRADGDPASLDGARRALDRLRRRLAEIPLRPTDLLGGDPGCWGETLDALDAVAR
jgi:hypothetical protein